jgi:hypothetical protein
VSDVTELKRVEIVFQIQNDYDLILSKYSGYYVYLNCCEQQLHMPVNNYLCHKNSLCFFIIDYKYSLIVKETTSNEFENFFI